MTWFVGQSADCTVVCVCVCEWHRSVRDGGIVAIQRTGSPQCHRRERYGTSGAHGDNDSVCGLFVQS